MYLDDPVDGQVMRKKRNSRLPITITVRHLIYAQLLVAILSVPIGRCEVWGYGRLLETGVCGFFFQPVVLILMGSAFVFPFLIIAPQLKMESPRKTWAGATAFFLSLAISYVQWLAFLPLVQ